MTLRRRSTVPGRARVLLTAACLSALGASCPHEDLPESRPLDEAEIGAPWRPGRAGSPGQLGSAPGDGRPVTLDVTPIRVRLDEHTGLDEAGRVFVRDAPLGPWRQALAASLPADAEARSLRVLGDVGTVWTARGLALCLDGRGWTLLPSLPDHQPREAIIDRSGHGVGLFLPERVASTRDFGRTWSALALPDVAVQRLQVAGDAVALLPGGIRDGFARRFDLHTGKIDRLPIREGTRPLGSQPRHAEPPRVAIDGDDIVLRDQLPNDPDVFARRGTGPLARLSRGRLGEPLVPLADAEADRCLRERVAVCGELVAELCGDRLRTYRGGARVAELSGLPDADLAFDAAGRLWTMEAIAGSPDDVRMRRRDPLALSSAPLDEHVLTLGQRELGFVGGCHRPALWAYGASGAARLRDDRFGERLARSETRAPVGVDRNGALVNRSSDELTFLPGKERTWLASSPKSLSFAEDGVHALLVADGGQLYQSDDAGRSFTPIHTPAIEHPSPVRCGRTSCELGDVAVRTGFARGKVAPSIWANQSAIERSPRDNPSRPGPRGHWLRCEVVPDRFVGAGRSDIAPRLGPWLFAASDSRPPPLGESTLGRLDGSLAPTKRAVDGGLGGAVFDGPSFFSSDGLRVARLDRYTGELTLLGGAAPETRSTLATPSRYQPTQGIVHVAANDTWWSVRTTEELRGNVVKLGRHPREDVPQSRDLFVGTAPLEEHVLGFLPGANGAPPSLLSLEGIAGTVPLRSELRARPLGDDLSLGASTAIPGTQGLADTLLELPACQDESPAAGALARLDADRPVEVWTDGFWRTSGLSRLIRVTPAGACVARTFFTAISYHAPGNLVLRGNQGEGYGFAGAVQCVRVVEPPEPPRRRRPWSGLF